MGQSQLAEWSEESEERVMSPDTRDEDVVDSAEEDQEEDEEEMQEELSRFTRAILLVGAPLPDAQDSRYRAKIYRGTSMTV